MNCNCGNTSIVEFKPNVWLCSGCFLNISKIPKKETVIDNRLYFTIGDETKRLNDWAKNHNIKIQTVRWRIKQGWDTLTAIMTTKHTKYKTYQKKNN